jgi:LysR family hydrogen peroxide-inducible transcriptional activator
VRRFLERHPDCELSLREDRTEHQVAALLEDAVDLAVMSTPIDQPRIELEVVGDEGLLVAAAPSMPMPSPSSIKIEDLEGRPLILVQEVHCLGQQVRDYCHARRIAARVVCEAAQISTEMRLVELGLGLSLVPEMAARAEPPGSARYWRLDEPEPRREIAVAWRAGRTRSRLAQSFVEVLRDELASGRHRCDPRCDARGRSGGSRS